MGSACMTPGWIMLEGERLPNAEQANPKVPVRQRISNLWGMHNGAGQPFYGDDAGGAYRLAGMSCAHFGGAEVPQGNDLWWMRYSGQPRGAPTQTTRTTPSG